jgi:hypothetical protein
MDLDRVKRSEVPGWPGKSRRHNDGYEPDKWENQTGEWASGGDDIETCRRYWKDGYMADDIERLAEGIAAKAEGRVTKRTRRRRYGVVGELDGDRWANGDYETAWVDRPRNGDGLSPIVNIVFAYGANASKTAEHLKWSGIAGAALAKALEDAGWRVGLYANIAMYHGGSKLDKQVSSFLIPVKNPEEMLRPGQVGALFAHPASFRIRAFRAMGGLAIEDPGSILGYCRGWNQGGHSEALKSAIGNKLGGNTIFVMPAFSADEAQDVVNDALAKVTNPLHAEAS